MPDRSRRDTLARQWELLRLLPSRPPGCTAAELTRSLTEKGFPTTKRTVERDLNELEQVFPFTCNDKGMPYGWYWIRDADLGIPGVELTEALSFTLLRGFLQQMLPVSLWRGFAPRLQHDIQWCCDSRTDHIFPIREVILLSLRSTQHHKRACPTTG